MRTDTGAARGIIPVSRSDVSFLCLVLSLVLAAAARGADDKPYDEPFRPQYHFTPAQNWMNDPNGCVFFDGEWHLFYQYNPEGDTWGHMSWGHAVSKDLVRWEHLPVALREEHGVMIFSGSAVVDHNNTSGFGQGGKPPLIAVYTGHGLGKQTQNIAYSNDRGRTWTKYAGNPVIDIASPEFRDPKVIWHEPTKRWVMVVARPDRKQVDFYGSPDLKKWEQLGAFGGQGAIDGIWECPDLFELPVMSSGKPSGSRRWVLVVNINGGTPAGGSGCQYFVGQFDGKTFVNDNPPNVKLWADYGADFYAAQSWADVPEQDGRRIWIAWMSNWRYANQEPTKPFRTAMTLPRELTLVETGEGTRLRQRPVTELAALRGKDSDELVLGNVLVSPENDPVAAQGFTGDAMEILMSFRNEKATEMGLTVFSGAGGKTRVGYDAAKNEYFIDRRESGKEFHKEFAARHTAPALRRGAGGEVILRVFVDRSSVELFADDGLTVISDRVFPTAGGGVGAFATGGSAELTSLQVWKLKSAWR